MSLGIKRPITDEVTPLPKRPRTTHSYLQNYNFILESVLKYMSDKDVITNATCVAKFLYVSDESTFRYHYTLKSGVTLERFQAIKQSKLRNVNFSQIIAKSIDELPTIKSFYPLFDSLKLADSYNHLIGVDILPNFQTLTSLTFGYHFNNPIAIGVLPDSLISLTFGSLFDQPLDINVLPKSIQHLVFGDLFNNVFVSPESIVSLEFGFRFNLPITDSMLSVSLRSLKFGYQFNQVVVLSKCTSLTSLEFGKCFNQSIQHCRLSASLQSITFGHYFNQSISLSPFNSLMELTLGSRFNASISLGDISICTKLKFFTFSGSSNKRIKEFEKQIANYTSTQ